MKNGKATGPDDLPTEALKGLDEQNIKTIIHLKSIEQKDKMVYSGELFTADWRCEKEVKHSTKCQEYSNQEILICKQGK